MLAFPCSHCGKELKAPEAASGKKGTCPNCGQVALVPSNVPKEYWDFLSPPQAPDELGRLGAFRILKILGYGGMGIVFKAEELSLGRKVALKAMLPSAAVSATNRARFLREARVAASLEHDHIVGIHQVGEDRGVHFIAMQLLKGESLEARLKRDGALPLPEILRIGREIAEGLAAAHQKGLVHRDIKPDNIFLEGKRARVKILDFGLARGDSQDPPLTALGMILGTLDYMAPEQASGKQIDVRADLFSLGCVLYRMTTGQMAFQGATPIELWTAVMSKTPKPPRELRAELSADLSDLILKLLAKERTGRPDTAQEVSQALEVLESPAVNMKNATVVMDAWIGTKPGEERSDNSLKMKFCWCPPGEFLMGSPPGEMGRYDDEDQVKVTLTEGFWMGKYEVTQEEWLRVMGGDNPSYFSPGTGAPKLPKHYSTRFPVELVSWKQATEFCRKFTEQEQKAGRLPSGWVYDLPTEAQWEYACRAGETMATAFGDKLSDELANFGDLVRFYFVMHGLEPDLCEERGLGRTEEVGKYPANAWGLHDMHGNVEEWCRDWYQPKLPGGTDPDASSVAGASFRVLRGGSFIDHARNCRSAKRGHSWGENVESGFRLAAVHSGR